MRLGAWSVRLYLAKKWKAEGHRNGNSRKSWACVCESRGSWPQAMENSYRSVRDAPWSGRIVQRGAYIRRSCVRSLFAGALMCGSANTWLGYVCRHCRTNVAHARIHCFALSAHSVHARTNSCTYKLSRTSWMSVSMLGMLDQFGRSLRAAT